MANIIDMIFKANTTEVKEAGKNIETLKEKLKELSKELPGLNSSVGKLGSELLGGTDSAALLAGGLAGIAVAASLAIVAIGTFGIAMAEAFNEKIDKLADLGAKMGITADQAYFMSKGMEDAGASLGALDSGFNKVAKAMTGTSEEMKGVGKAFAQLNVDVATTNGTLKDSGTVMDEVIASYEKSNKNANDTAAIMQILGKSYKDVIVARHAEKIANEEANAMYEQGIGITKAAQEAADASETSHRKLGFVMLSMGAILVEKITPAFTALTDWFIKSYTEGGIVAKAFTVIVYAAELLMVAIKGIASGVMVLVEAWSVLQDVTFSAGKALWQALSGDFKGASQTAGAAIDHVATRVKSLKTDLTSLWAGTSNVGVKINNKDELNKPIFGDHSGGTSNDDAAIAKAAREAEKLAKELEASRKAALALYEAAEKAGTTLTDELNKQLLGQTQQNKVTMITLELTKAKYALTSDVIKAEALQLAQQVDKNNAEKIATDGIKKMTDSTRSYVDAIHLELDAVGKTKFEIMNMTQEKKIDLAVDEAIQKLKDEHLYSLEKENQLITAGTKAKQDSRKATEELKKADDDWLGRGMAEYVKGIGTMNDAFKNLTVSGIKGVEDGLFSLFTTGEFGFKAFVKSILEQMLRMVIQFQIMAPILAAFKNQMAGSGSAGGVLDAVTSFFSTMFSAHGNAFTTQHAKGDVVTSPTNFAMGSGIGQMGEAGDEGILPLKRNAAGDLGVIASGGGSKGGISIVNSITITNSGNQSTEDMKSQAQMITNLIDRRFHENLATANRSGGSMNRTSMQIG